MELVMEVHTRARAIGNNSSNGTSNRFMQPCVRLREAIETDRRAKIEST